MLCPRCGGSVDAPVCARCGLDLADPRAVRLGEINREYAELLAERDGLLTDLDDRAFGALPPPAPSPVAPAPSGPSGQHILLTLGALLLLGAGSVFVLAVWLLVGRYGQVALLLAAVGSGVVASFLLARRLLAASAETAAALGIGFAVIAASAAHGWNLLGLHAIPLEWYSGGGSALCGTLAVAAYLGSRRGPAPIRAYAWTAGGGFSVSAIIATSRVSAVTSAESGRDVAAIVLLVYAAGLVTLLPRWPDLRRGINAGLGWGAAALIGIASFVPLSVLPYQALVVVAVVVSVAVSAMVLRRRIIADRLQPAAALFVAYLPYLYALLLPLWRRGVVGSDSLRESILGDGPFSELPLWAPTIAALALALPACAAVARFRTRPGYGVASVVALELLGSLALSNALARSSSRSWAVVAVAYVAVQVGLVVWARVRNSAAPAHWAAVELTANAAAALGGLVGIASAMDVDHRWLVGVLAALTALAAVVASLPARRGIAYLAAVLGTAAWWVALDRRGSVEAYVLPGALMLLAAGVVIWLADRRIPTIVTLGPALVMAVLPPTLVGVVGGDALRLTAATVAAAVLVCVGVGSRLLAPVLVGGFVVLIVVVTQGGPYVAVIPYWITGGVLGMALVAGGVAWERTAAYGRRSIAWFATLR